MAIRSSIGTPCSSAASLNSVKRDDSGWASGLGCAKVGAAPRDPSKATPARLVPLSFRKALRSMTLVSAPDLGLEDPSICLENIPPLSGQFAPHPLFALCLLSLVRHAPQASCSQQPLSWLARCKPKF